MLRLRINRPGPGDQLNDSTETSQPSDCSTTASLQTGRQRWATLVAGWSLVVVGAALLVLPGPGVPLVLGGLALIGREQAWARRLRARIEGEVRRRVSRAGAWFRRQPR